jgi:hypothetical protein
MQISVTYEDTDVAKALMSIIKHENKEEFVKLLTPMVCSSSIGCELFFKLMLGNKLPLVISEGTICKAPIADLGYGSNKDEILKMFPDPEDKAIVKVKQFRGYHEWSPYIVEYVAAVGNGTNKRATTYVRANELEVIEEF